MTEFLLNQVLAVVDLNTNFEADCCFLFCHANMYTKAQVVLTTGLHLEFFGFLTIGDLYGLQIDTL